MWRMKSKVTGWLLAEPRTIEVISKGYQGNAQLHTLAYLKSMITRNNTLHDCWNDTTQAFIKQKPRITVGKVGGTIKQPIFKRKKNLL